MAKPNIFQFRKSFGTKTSGNLDGFEAVIYGYQGFAEVQEVVAARLFFRNNS